MAKKMLWLETCTFCNQGRLFIYKNMQANMLYLHCEECERGYYDPIRTDPENSFLTILEDFDSIAATAEDIKEHNWDELQINIVDE